MKANCQSVIRPLYLRASFFVLPFPIRIVPAVLEFICKAAVLKSRPLQIEKAPPKLISGASVRAFSRFPDKI